MFFFTNGYNNPSSDLHKKSPKIFLLCLIVSILFTFILITISIPQKNFLEDKIDIPPVIIHLENIPETRQRVMVPAPTKPFIPSGAPIESDDLLPDEITIEDTKLDLDATPEAPPALLIPGIGAEKEENEVYEFFNVEENPKPLNNIVPEYPEIARRAGIEGTVILKVLVNVTGVVDSVEVIEGSDVFIKSAADAARATKFTPAKHNDRNVACWVTIPFRFIK